MIATKYGFWATLRRIKNKIINKKVEVSSIFPSVKHLFEQRNGIEIGGPSYLFHTYLPIYQLVDNLDGCNFSTKTVWEGTLAEGLNFKYLNKVGFQYICDATNLSPVDSDKYDFVISSNCLEHIANPLKAVKEWLRVIKKDGIILIIVPNKDFCFDHNRSFTTFEHIENDYKNDIGEDDLSSLDEILQHHDLSMDKAAGTFEQFKARSLQNFENRCLHHHVFSIDLLKQIFTYFDIEYITEETSRNFIIIGKKK